MEAHKPTATTGQTRRVPRPLTKTGLTNGATYTFKVRAITVTSGSTTPGPHTAVVTGTPGVVVTARFGAAAYSVREGSRFNVEVTLSADPRRTVEILIYKNHGAGARNDDYFMGTLDRVIFMPGQTRKSFGFYALRDGDADANETVTLNLGQAYTPVYTSGGNRETDPHVFKGTPSATTITITDVARTNYVDFGEVNYETHEFPEADYTVREGRSVEVSVTLRDYPRSSVTIPIMKANSGGTSARDYSGVPATVTFSTSEKTKTFTFMATDDTVRDPNEQILLTFGNLPQGLPWGANRFAFISIEDND